MKTGQRKLMWQRRLAAWRSSGTALMPYCVSKGLSYSSMKRWRERLASSGTRNAPRGAVAPPVGALVPIEILSPTSVAVLPTPAIEIRLRGGRAIVIDGEIDHARLAALIGVGERAP